MEKTPPKRLWKHLGLAALILAGLGFFISLHFIQLGGELLSIDESMDMQIVNCYVEQGSPFACPLDFSQARLPYYIHAFAQALTGNTFEIHYIVSFLFGLATLGLFTWFTKQYFGKQTALILFFLLITSVPLLTGSRMLLSTSNIIFLFFSLATVVSAFIFCKRQTLNRLIFSSILFGCALASNLLAIWLVLLLVPLYIFSGVRFKAIHLLAIPVTFSSFLIASPFYLADGRLFELFDHLVHFEFQPQWWNYLNLGSYVPPWWFSLVLFIVKMTPWLAVLYFFTPFLLKNATIPGQQKALIYSIFFATVLYMLIKPLKFGYDAPHHHIMFFVMSLLPLAFVLHEAWKPRGQRIFYYVAFAGILSLQIFFILLLFPHEAFYGAQYGEKFIGDVYGPAVVANPSAPQLRELFFSTAGREDEQILFPRGAIYLAELGVMFDARDPSASYKYAFDSIFIGHHLHYSQEAKYDAYLAEHCEKIWNLVYPLGYEIYGYYYCDH